MEFYAGKQGYLAYDADKNQASTPFHIYNNIQTEVYDYLEQSLKRKMKVIYVLDWSTIIPFENHEHAFKSNFFSQTRLKTPMQNEHGGGLENLVSPSGSISSYSPTTARGGFDTLTINGSGFGSTQGTSFVLFPQVEHTVLIIAPINGLFYKSPRYYYIRKYC